jgi:hypothetical protein
MREVTAGRTLVKSPPELWAVCSDAESLSQHLEAFGEIRITRLEPETTVAWEGERASGTVRIEPSGWGTKVTVTAAATEPAAAPESHVAAPANEEPGAVVPDPDPNPDTEPLLPEAEHVPPEPEPTRRPGFLVRLFGGARGSLSRPVVSETAAPEQNPDADLVVAAPEPVLAPQPELLEPEPTDHEQPPVDAAAALEAALDSLGQAHRRPFSR